MNNQIFDKLTRLVVLQIGAGGTGSWLADALSKFLNTISNRFDQNSFRIQYIIADGDVVEQRNTIRQNFSECDIGRNKSEAIALRNASHMPIIAHPHFIKSKIGLNKIIYKYTHGIRKSLLVVFGCVDKNNIRKLIFKVLSDYTDDGTPLPIVYMDSGNELYNGQVITSQFNTRFTKLRRDYQTTRTYIRCLECSYSYEDELGDRYYRIFNYTDLFTNYDTFENPDFLKIYRTDKKKVDDGPSCAFFGDQSQGINWFAASIMFNNFQKMLINGLLPPKIISFHSSGYSTFEL